MYIYIGASESFTFEHGDCRIYGYSPFRENVGPKPVAGGRKKVIYLFTPKSDACYYESKLNNSVTFVTKNRQQVLLIPEAGAMFECRHATCINKNFTYACKFQTLLLYNIILMMPLMYGTMKCNEV